jgi:copper(I)-binding protein
MMKKSYVLLFLAALLAACGPSVLSVREAWARPALEGGTGAAYLILQNGTSEAVTLTGASTDVARVVELHTSMMMTEGEMNHGDHGDMHPTASPAESDVAMMMPVDTVEVAAGSSLQLTPGGYHVMLIDLQRALVVGETFTLTLHFVDHDDIEVEVSVIAQ